MIRTMIVAYEYKDLNLTDNSELVDVRRQVVPFVDLRSIEQSKGGGASWPGKCPKCSQTSRFIVYRVEENECTYKDDGHLLVVDIKDAYVPHWIFCCECQYEGELKDFAE